MAILVERSFTSLSLLALLPLHQIRYRGVPPLLWLSTNTVATLVERGFTSLVLPPLLWYLNRHSGNPCGKGLHLPSSSCPPPSASDQIWRSSTGTALVPPNRGSGCLGVEGLHLPFSSRPAASQVRYGEVIPLPAVTIQTQLRP